jgi:hypothetical protein
LAAGEQTTVDLVLWRGVDVSVELVVDGWPVGSGLALLEHRDSGQRVEFLVTTQTGRGSRVLPRGRWQVSFEPPSGFLLTTVHHNGLELATPMASLDLDTEPFPAVVGFGFVVESRISGRVTTNLTSAERRPTLELEATLLGPNSRGADDWGRDERARAGSRVEQVKRAYSWRDDFYELPLPSGQWRLRPVSDRPMVADPASIDFDIAVGGAIELDFAVEFQDDDQPLRISVKDERGLQIEGATVDVTVDDRTFEPLLTSKIGQAVLYGVEPGDVVSLVARHPEHLDGEAELEFQTDAAAFRLPSDGLPAGDGVAIELDRGAGFLIEAFDLEGRVLPGVEVVVEDVTVQGKVEDSEEKDSDRSQRRSGTTDRRGEARVTGLLAGRYLVSASMALGKDAELGYVVLEQASAVADSSRFERRNSIEVDLRERQRVPLRAQLVPAAYFEATLLCTDGEPLPPSVDVQVFRAVRQVTETVSETVRDEQPALELSERRLSGPGRDRLRAGPLDAGVFELAIRSRSRPLPEPGLRRERSAERSWTSVARYARRRFPQSGSRPFQCRFLLHRDVGAESLLHLRRGCREEEWGGRAAAIR